MALAGCASVGYYGQALRGHLDLTFKRKSIDRLLADANTPQELRARLERIQDIRHFAVTELGLPDSGSYSDYADLGRDVTVWMLTAAPEFEMAARKWCYPFVGCLNYRGFFSREAAEAEAARLYKEGFETSISPGIAYSTLGFMDDPVLNTMLVYDDARLAGVIFHELAHELLFVKGDGRFNESFASAVEKIGRDRYVAARNLSVQPVDEGLRNARQKAFIDMLLDARTRLGEVYDRGGSVAVLRAEKTKIHQQLIEGYAAFKAQWDGYRGFDRWFRHGAPNNAQLALLATYESAVPAFEALYAAADHDLSAFYRLVEGLAALPRAERYRQLKTLTPELAAQ